jgi:dihydropteroate synthase type 2
VRRAPSILGIVNVTEDSFSDGGLYLEPERAIAHALRLHEDGADVIDLGAASSHPDAKQVSPEEEVRRLGPVVDRLMGKGIPISVDSFRAETQLWALERGVAFLNDIQGFPDPAIYPELARASARLVVMHSIQRRGGATRVRGDPRTIFDRVVRFFGERLEALERAGISRDRLVIDPGMGFFLGADPEPSLVVLRRIGELRERFGAPVLISVSRKSVLASLTGRATEELLPATLAAELHAAAEGVDYIRTHDVRALRDALTVARALEAPS